MFQTRGSGDGIGQSQGWCNTSERRVRNGLYRLASGRMTIRDVRKSVEKDGSSSLDLDDTEGKMMPQTVLSSSFKVDTSESAARDELSTTITVDGKIIGIDDVLKIKKEIVEWGLVAQLREKKVLELLNERERCEKRINKLLANEASLKDKQANEISDEDVKLSALYIKSFSRNCPLRKEKWRI